MMNEQQIIMKNALLALLNNLENVEAEHPEINDTAVREELHAAIFGAFIEPKPGYELPTGYAMFSDEADAQIRTALAAFLTHPEVIAAASQLQTSAERLAAFQNDDLESSNGNYTGDYFGWA